MTSKTQASNRLSRESSPYLLQHAHDPVDWYPWGEEAIARARREDKPILLSIGYSACHWCHVMAHESFTDDTTAAVMNESFINIKVDREERPDLDKAYQLAHQLLTRRPGGWPLTVFLDPHNLVPFFAGTYFPKTARYGLPGFVPLLRQVAEWYHREKGALAENNRAILGVLAKLAEETMAAEEPDAALLTQAWEALRTDFDALHGGFGSAPKFPHPGLLAYCLTRGGQAREAALFTLKKMAEGGLYDHLGGGFFRYAVDAEWRIPHFEKMLYDNGPLLALYAQAWHETGDAFFRRIAHETGDWALREMQAPEGGFYASLDADSEGEEGKFYLWTREQVQPLLSPATYALLGAHLGLDQTPNCENRWHLHIAKGLADIAAGLGLSLELAETRLTQAKATLFAAREQRIHPARDGKILTAWNALMIQGLARAGRLLGRDDFIAAADMAFAFLRRALWVDGRLYAAWKDGRARFAAYLDDYAFLLDAALELLHCRWSANDLQWSLELAEGLLEHFEDSERGGFFFTAHDHEPLIYRAKPLQDEAMASGNAIAARALMRLAAIIGDARLQTAAEKTLKASLSLIRRDPLFHGSMLTAVHEWLHPQTFIVLRGEAATMAPWQALANRTGAYTLTIPAEETQLPGLLRERLPRENVVAYVCRGIQCLAPMENLEDFRALLDEEANACPRQELSLSPGHHKQPSPGQNHR